MAFLADPASHDLAEGEVRRIDTHAAIVFLAGARAYKLKRAIKLPFLDYSSLARREAACRAELRLNRRTAPDIYLDVSPVTRGPDGRLGFGGNGETLDWVVVMRRFDDSRLLDRLSRAGPLGTALAISLAEAIATFHARAEPAADGADAAEMRRTVEVAVASLRLYGDGVFAPGAVESLVSELAAELDTRHEVLNRRRAEGHVKHCHGDLHLRNIFLENGRPVIFDAIEFDDRLARTDVVYDLAFLLMDLWHRGLRSEANIVLNRYLLLTDDCGSLEPLPLFLSIRAAIRAHVSAMTAETQPDAVQAAALRQEAGEYLGLARELLLPAAPRLIGLGGYSGTGKSTLARALAPLFRPPPGAIVLRSDEIRKRLLGAAPEAALDPSAYTPEISARVYDALRRQAACVLAAGYTAIADAVNDRQDSREALADLAAAADVPFTGLWLAARPEVMAARIASRGADASDATAEIMQRQVDTGSVPTDWPHLDAEADFPDLLAAAQVQLDNGGSDHEAP
ncbi:MAG: AAA family ATPase [Alphaproteobacteria bacterium]|nr:AAA family ATPase [Alphaproteobacteria bacterium]